MYRMSKTERFLHNAIGFLFHSLHRYLVLFLPHHSKGETIYSWNHFATYKAAWNYIEGERRVTWAPQDYLLIDLWTGKEVLRGPSRN